MLEISLISYKFLSQNVKLLRLNLVFKACKIILGNKNHRLIFRLATDCKQCEIVETAPRMRARLSPCKINSGRREQGENSVNLRPYPI